MRKGFGFQQQRCANDDGVWMKSHVQKHSYTVHEYAWGNNPNAYHHKQFPGMHMKPGSAFKRGGGGHGGFQESWHGGHDDFQEGSWQHSLPGYGHRGGKRFPYRAPNVSFPSPCGGHNGYHSESEEAESEEAESEAAEAEEAESEEAESEEAESEEADYEPYREAHHGKIDEMRYERHNNWGDVYYSNPYERNGKWKPHGGHKKVERSTRRQIMNLPARPIMGRWMK